MKKSLFDFIETIARILPEAVTMYRATSQEGFIEATEKLLITAIANLEQQANSLRHSREDTITGVVIGFFNRYGIRAHREKNSRGHVDIFVDHDWKQSLTICGEAKIWDGVIYHSGGLKQVLGYSTGRVPYCFLLIYVTTGGIQTHMESLREYLNQELPEEQQGPCEDHNSQRWTLCSSHMHSSQAPVRVVHAGVNLFIPEEEKGVKNAKSTKPVTPRRKR